jgi:type II secretory pathway pseudopilin PulG
MSLKEQINTKAARGNVKEAFKNEAGAIDLASIMVGIIVIGLIGGVIAATVFAVIPWAQDNAAKQQLDAVVTAQSAYFGLSADATTLATKVTDFQPSKYASQDQLSQAGLFTGDKAVIRVKARLQATNFVSVVKSGSGKYFMVTSFSPIPGLTDEATFIGAGQPSN